MKINTPSDLGRYNAKQSAKKMNLVIPDRIFDDPSPPLKKSNPIIDFFRNK
jgi:hypothetical protein